MSWVSESYRRLPLTRKVGLAISFIVVAEAALLAFLSMRFRDAENPVSDPLTVCVALGSLAIGLLLAQGVLRSIRVAEEERERFFAHAPDLLAITENDGRVVDANPAWLTTLGLEPRELLGHSWETCIVEEDRPTAQAALERARRGEAVQFLELRCRGKDGAARHLRWSLHSQPGGSRLYAVGRDVTTRKRLERELEQAHKLEAIGRLSSGVAHEFNNLLTAVLGYGDLLANQPGLDASGRGYAENIRRAALRGTDLTRRLDAFTRQLGAPPQRTDLARGVRSLEPVLRRTLDPKARLQVEIAEPLPSVLIDPGQFEQVLLNLCLNANDAMPRGGDLRVTLETRVLAGPAAEFPTANPGRYVQLVVRDTGVGMGDEVKARLYEPFFSTKPAGQGAGLGLATCFGIVHQVRGHLACESAPGRGTTFTLLFPAAPEGEAGADEGAAERRPAAILLAEDEAELRGLLQALLERMGHRVIAVEDGAAARDYLQAHPDTPVDLLITDMLMPRLGGRELAEWLRERRPQLKVLFTSGYIEREASDLLATDGGTAFLEKPFTPDALSGKVDRLLAAP